MQRNIVIIVEGVDDAWFVDKILDDLGADPQKVGVIYIEGKDKLFDNVDILLKTSSYITRSTARIVFLLDRDDIVTDKLGEITATLSRLKIPAPQHGKIVRYDGGRELGLFLIPSDVQGGALEELLLATVPTDPVLLAVDGCLAGVEAGTPMDHRSKRLMQMYLACGKKLCNGGGFAFRRGTFSKAAISISAVETFLASAIA